MGIQVIQGPGVALGETPGPLNLPAGFDRKKWAAKWVKQGPSVEAAAEREWIPGTKVTADGWQVWRDSQKKPHVVALQSGKHVLLCRPKVVQEAVNAICGNLGKSRLQAERKGETIMGAAPKDAGMLSDDRITKATGQREELEEGDIQMNPVPDTEDSARVETPALKVVSGSRIKRRAS